MPTLTFFATVFHALWNLEFICTDFWIFLIKRNFCMSKQFIHVLLTSRQLTRLWFSRLSKISLERCGNLKKTLSNIWLRFPKFCLWTGPQLLLDLDIFFLSAWQFWSPSIENLLFWSENLDFLVAIFTRDWSPKFATLKNGHVKTLSSHFFANYKNIHTSQNWGSDTVFPHIVAVATTLFWNGKTLLNFI